MMKQLVLGYLGNGKSTNRYHLPFVLNRPETIRVKTIYDRSLRKRQSPWEAVPGVHYTDDLSEMLQDSEIDVIVCTTPVQSHLSLVREILLAGKHCLLEKPFAMTAAEARELFALAKEKNLLLEGYQNRRFDSDFLTVQQVIESGKLGDLLEVEMHFDYYRPYVPEGITQFRREESYVYNHACHTVDQVLSYFGNPDSIHYDVRQLLGSGRMNDYFDMDFHYGRLKVSVKSSYFRIKTRPSFVVYGTRGMFLKQDKDQQENDLKKGYLPGPDHQDFGVDTPEQYGTLTYCDEAGGFHEEKVVSAVGDYARFYDALYASVVQGQPPLVTEAQTLKQLEILEQAVAGLE